MFPLHLLLFEIRTRQCSTELGLYMQLSAIHVNSVLSLCTPHLRATARHVSFSCMFLVSLYVLNRTHAKQEMRAIHY